VKFFLQIFETLHGFFLNENNFKNNNWVEPFKTIYYLDLAVLKKKKKPPNTG
jgi:hypothetical protein